MTMTSGLRRMMAITDGLMLLYWVVTALAAAGLIPLSSALLYKDYHDPVMVAWNWSFLPLDLGFSLLGLAALARSRRGQNWQGLAIISLTLTSCAGLMAIAFWLLRGDFDLQWWLPNLALALLPWIWLPGLTR